MKHLNKRRLSRWIGKRSVFGATVTEMISILLIGAVTIGYAVPNFQAFIINNRTISGTNMVVSALNFARSEAIKRGVPVSVCATFDYATCTSGVWHEGWMVFTDEPIAGLPDGPDEVLRTQQGVDLDISLVSGQTFIRFAPNGALADAGLDNDFEGIASSLEESSPLRSLVASLLPISPAYADDDDSSGGHRKSSGGGGHSKSSGSLGWSWPKHHKKTQTQSSTQQTSGTGQAVFEIKVCPKKAGYKGRTIKVSANGQIRTVEATC